jgi:hypothetical protein
MAGWRWSEYRCAGRQRVEVAETIRQGWIWPRDLVAYCHATPGRAHPSKLFVKLPTLFIQEVPILKSN